MPKDDRKIDLDNLKVDPRLWMRLAMPLDDGNVLGNVFHGKENPFEKNGVPFLGPGEAVVLLQPL